MHYYQYLHDPDFVIESETPRPDLLEWAYWSEIDAPTKPVASVTVTAEPEQPTAVKKAPAKKTAPRKAVRDA